MKSLIPHLRRNYNGKKDFINQHFNLQSGDTQLQVVSEDFLCSGKISLCFDRSECLRQKQHIEFHPSFEEDDETESLSWAGQFLGEHLQAEGQFQDR